MINFSKIPLFLAPMANFTDLPFRAVVKKFGADATISEMISANALVFESKKTLKMLEKSDIEKPFIVQIAGNSEVVIKKAVQILNSLDFIDGIDLNCGCPVPKVVRQNAGSALLRDLDLLAKLVSTIKDSSKKPTTSVKFRLGFDTNEAAHIAAVCEAAGADFVAIHGRSAKQMYRGNADYKAICEAKAAVKIPVIANGDISSENALQVLQITGADGLMIGRGAVGKPWIFAEIKQILERNLAKNSANLSSNLAENLAKNSMNLNENLAKNLERNFVNLNSNLNENFMQNSINLNVNSAKNLVQNSVNLNLILAENLERNSANLNSNLNKNSMQNLAVNLAKNSRQSPKFEASKALKKEVIMYHFEMMIKHFGARGAVLFRKHLHEYSKGLEGASAFRDEINRTIEPTQMSKKIAAFFG